SGIWRAGGTGMSTVVAVYSEKGGVGKSALAGGLVAAARAKEIPVVGGDLDPRATFSAELGAPEAPDFSMNDLLAMDPQGEVGLAADALTSASDDWPGVRLIAAERALANRETDNVSVGLEFRLKLALRGVIEDGGVGVLDLPPRAGGKLVTAALVAATHVVIPATLDEDGRIGAKEALATIDLVRNLGMNPDLKIVGIVPSIVPPGANLLRDEIDDYLADTYGELYRKDLAIPRHAVRQQSRFACVPITAAPGKAAQTLTKVYGKILNAAGVGA
ncbi:ParA family protein, partial [Streptomyces sp. NPDC051016]|uniref:ParA family protein n=1 Tax=Streptomyces sp. NPDC051016 TaxID=3365638 RepID=UPI003789CAEA